MIFPLKITVRLCTSGGNTRKRIRVQYFILLLRIARVKERKKEREREREREREHAISPYDAQFVVVNINRS